MFILAVTDTPCNPSPCVNGGTCFTRSGGTAYSCVCPPDVTGTNCQSPSKNDYFLAIFSTIVASLLSCMVQFWYIYQVMDVIRLNVKL